MTLFSPWSRDAVGKRREKNAVYEADPDSAECRSVQSATCYRKVKTARSLWENIRLHFGSVLDAACKIEYARPLAPITIVKKLNQDALQGASSLSLRRVRVF